MAAPSVSSSSLRFDPRSLEIKTKSVEQTLVPLVSQVLQQFIVHFTLYIDYLLVDYNAGELQGALCVEQQAEIGQSDARCTQGALDWTLTVRAISILRWGQLCRRQSSGS
jgi:hypothetical protein